MTTRSHAKKDFATRLSPQTLARLDQLIRSGRFKTRTAAIEAAVERLVEAEQQEYELKRRALDDACGMFSLGIDSKGLREAESDRYDYEADQNAGRSER
jgi:Arc/MetJ-type ribon-helix-helix transcriptional regulator